MVSLARATAWSSSVNRISARTGPNTSRWARSLSASTSPNTVGCTKYPAARSPPARPPPVSRVPAPLARVASITPRIRSQLAASITGPSCTPSSNGRPMRSAPASAATFAARRLVHRFVHEQSGRQHAPLTADPRQRGLHDGGRGEVEVGVVEHDRRRLAAELEHDRRQGRRRRRGDPLGGRRPAGEADLGDAWVTDEGGAGVGSAGHGVEHTGRDARPQRQLGEAQRPERAPARPA